MLDLNSQKKLSYNDVSIVPAGLSYIYSRSECNPYYNDGMLPLFTAPMSTVIDENNVEIWENNKINVIVPRTVSLEKRKGFLKKGIWIALSLKEFKEMFINCFINSDIDKYLDNYQNDTRLYYIFSNFVSDYGEEISKGKCHPIENINSYHICIDIANGHMKRLYDLIYFAKEIAGIKGYDLTIMAGNIANPQTYKTLIEDYNGCVDYVRLSIGSGNGCTTSSNTGVHYPIASLISECREYKDNYDYTHTPKIIADGGIRNYNDVIKALALGADYVMIGSVFAGFFESASKFIYENLPYNGDIDAINQMAKDIINDEEAKRDFIRKYNNGMRLYKEFYGMSTKRAQSEIHQANCENNQCNIKLKTSEGCEKLIKCEYTIYQWIENFVNYLRSAMSYTNIDDIKNFHKVVCINISNNTVSSVNK